MITEITLKNYRCFSQEKPARISLRKGFIGFVGVNNSGKSSLLKFFFEFRALFGLLTNPNHLKNAINGDLQSWNLAPSIYDKNEIFSNVNTQDLEMDFRFNDMNQNTDIAGEATRLTRLVITVPRNTNSWSAEFYSGNQHLNTKAKSGQVKIKDKVLHILDKPETDLAFMIEFFQKLQSILYIGPFRNAINIGTKEDYFDIQVGQSFIKKWRAYKTGNIRSQNEAAYTLTQNIKHIFEFNEFEINPSEDEKTLQIFINGKSYRLLELGSGLAQFIIVLANAAIRQSSYILIDEPELNLHPSLQIDFLTTLATYASEGVLFATHNIGLARAVADRVYSFRQATEGKSEVTDLETTPRLSEFLGELTFPYFSGHQVKAN